MSAPIENPVPLAQDTEANSGRLLRIVQSTPARLPTAARARIATRLDAETNPADPARARLLWPAFVVGGLLLFAGGAVGAAWGLAPARRFVVQLLHRPPAPRVAVRATAAPVAAPAPAAPPEEEPPIEAPPPAPVAPVRAAPRARSQAARPVEAPPPADAPIVVESRMLADALAALRQRHEPQQALRALDAYERRFPAGALAPEAAAARIDALLALGRRGQALERLDGLQLERLPRGAELRVLRGELRAGRGRLDEAVSDFSAVLALSAAPPAVVERALYGRGSCRSRLGDAAGARADLREVIRRFPTGALAGAAERALRD